MLGTRWGFMNKKEKKKKTGETDSPTDYDVSVNESKSLGPCFWVILQNLFGRWLLPSPPGLFWFTRRRPPFKNPCCPWSLFWVSGVNEPRHHSTNLSGRGAREETQKKCLHSDASAWFTALLLLVVVLRDFLDWPLSPLAGRWSAKPPSGWPFLLSRLYLNDLLFI